MVPMANMHSHATVADGHGRNTRPAGNPEYKNAAGVCLERATETSTGPQRLDLSVVVGRQNHASRTCFSCSSDRRLLSASVAKLPKSRPRSAAVSMLRLEGDRIGRGRDGLGCLGEVAVVNEIVVGQDSECARRWRGI